MQLSILAAGLALRGPDGSMSYALAETRKEYRNVIRLFYSGAHTLKDGDGMM